MKKEVILVPKDKCPLDVLAEMGEKTKNAWVYLHENAVEKLKQTAPTIEEYDYEELVWPATEKYPTTILDIAKAGTWRWVYRIDADDIAFTVEPQDPEDIIFLKMEE